MLRLPFCCSQCCSLAFAHHSEFGKGEQEKEHSFISMSHSVWGVIGNENFDLKEIAFCKADTGAGIAFGLRGFKRCGVLSPPSGHFLPHCTVLLAGLSALHGTPSLQ
jgi:hypothetical protein